MSIRAWHRAFETAKGFYSDFQEFLAPASCLCCGRDRDFEDTLLCPDCIKSLNDKNIGIGPVCPFCGNAKTGSACVSCNAPADLNLYYWGVYENELQKCILQFKFHGARELGIRLAEMAQNAMTEKQSPIAFDLIVPVPLHGRRQRQRQYNQSELLAARLAELLGLECCSECLRRTRSTFQQAKLAEDKRWENVRDVFTVQSVHETKIADKHILLVDDIVTTGATVYEASKALKSAGAAKVDIFSLAYAI
jgi:ComF family protein